MAIALKLILRSVVQARQDVSGPEIWGSFAETVFAIKAFANKDCAFVRRIIKVVQFLQ